MTDHYAEAEECVASLHYAEDDGKVHAMLALTDQVARIADHLDGKSHPWWREPELKPTPRADEDGDADEALVDEADEDSTVRPGLYVSGRRVGTVAGSWEWGADGKWHRTSWTRMPTVQWHYTEPDPDESPVKAAKEAIYGIEAEDDSRAAWLMSSRDDALRRAEWAEGLMYNRQEARNAEANMRRAAEDDRDAWKGRYTDLLWRIGELHRAWLSHKCRSVDCEAAHREHAEHLADLLPDEGDNR